MRDWFKARNAWGAAILSLPDEDAGKLAKALWAYTMNGQLPTCGGYISGLFTMMQITLDQDMAKEAEISNKRAAAGSRGGVQRIANASICLQMQANEANADNKNKNKNEEKEKEKYSDKESESFLLDQEAFEIQKEHDRVLDAAEDAGFKMSNDVRANLISLYAEHGLQKMLEGFHACSEHSAPNLAYLRAVLKGGAKVIKGKVLPAQDFQQRDYSGVQKQLEEEQKQHVIEMLCKNNGLWDEANNCPVDGWREKLDRMKAQEVAQ